MTESVPAFESIRTTVLTARGIVAAEAVRLEYGLTEQTGADRADCLDLIRDLVDAAGATVAVPGTPSGLLCAWSEGAEGGVSPA